MLKWGMTGPLKAMIKMCFLRQGDYHIVWEMQSPRQHSRLSKEEEPNVEASFLFEMQNAPHTWARMCARARARTDTSDAEYDSN